MFQKEEYLRGFQIMRTAACPRSNCPPPKQEGCPPRSSPVWVSKMQNSVCIFDPSYLSVPGVFNIPSYKLDFTRLPDMRCRHSAVHSSRLIEQDYTLSAVPGVRELGLWRLTHSILLDQSHSAISLCLPFPR